VNAALFSIQATIRLNNGLSPDINELLKACAILYPRLILLFGQESTMDVADMISPGVLARNRKEARKFLLPITTLDRKWEDTVGQFELLKNVDKWVSTRSDMVDVKELAKLIDDWLTSVPNGDPEAMVKHPFFALALSTQHDVPYHDDVSRLTELVKILKVDSVQPNDQQSLKIALPEVGKLSWDEVWALRDSPYLERFRLFAQAKLQPNLDQAALMKEIEDALWSIVGLSQPSPNGSIITRAAGTIPVPFGLPNPIAAAKDIRDGKAEKTLYANYGWVFFMQQVQAAAA